jgi:DNA processing protein
MVTAEKIYYNALAKSLNSNYEKLAAIYESENKFEKTWNSLSKELKTFNPKEEFEKLKQNNIDLIFRDEDNFPHLLKEIPLPPVAIYVKGKINPEAVSLSIVGTRKATPDGEEIAYELAKKIAENNIQVVSGLAMGIDAASHQGALKVKGKTVAVLGRGLEEIYPKTNEHLAEEILKNDGAIISEYPIGSEPLPHRFLERNRIISGISIATILIEAPEKSGSISTARFAMEQNRDLFVIPGPANHRNYSGSHKLIRDGARLATSFEEILTDLEIEIKPKNMNLSEEELLILEAIKLHKDFLAFDEIVEITKLEPAKANKLMGKLLAKSIIEEMANGYKITNSIK